MTIIRYDGVDPMSNLRHSPLALAITTAKIDAVALVASLKEMEGWHVYQGMSQALAGLPELALSTILTCMVGALAA